MSEKYHQVAPQICYICIFIYRLSFQKNIKTYSLYIYIIQDHLNVLFLNLNMFSLEQNRFVVCNN